MRARDPLHDQTWSDEVDPVLGTRSTPRPNLVRRSRSSPGHQRCKMAPRKQCHLL